jgi:hypothetical protein
MTKREQHYFDLYCIALEVNHCGYGILDIYKEPSARKQSIWDSIIFDMQKVSGTYPSVITYTSFCFTAAFVYEDKGFVHFRLYTPSKTSDVVLSPEQCERLYCVYVHRMPVYSNQAELTKQLKRAKVIL